MDYRTLTNDKYKGIYKSCKTPSFGQKFKTLSKSVYNTGPGSYKVPSDFFET